MTVVLWTETAEQDIEDILTYYFDEAGVRVAQSIYVRIRAQVQSLAQFPERARPGRVAGTREFVIARLPFIAVIQVQSDAFFIPNIVHTARKYPA